MKKSCKTAQFNVRMDELLREKFASACDVTGDDEATIVRACVKAFVDAVERDGQITKPFALVPAKHLVSPAP